MTFYQTRSKAIIHRDSVPADCIEKVVNIKSKKILHESVYLSLRPPPKSSLASSTWRSSEDSKTKVECCEMCGKDETDMHTKVDYRIQRFSHAAVEQEDNARKELISRLVHQIKNRPNKDALTAE